MTSTDHPTAGGLVVPHPDVHDDAEPAPDAVALVPVQVHYPTLASQQAHRISDAKATHRLQHRVQARLASSQLGHPTPTQLVCLHETLTDRIHRQVGQGATVHQRLPRLLRAIPPVVALLDLVVLFSFCADIFDVPLDHPWTARAPMALMLALLASGVAYAWFSLTGRALRGYRTPMGEVEWGTTGPTTRVMLTVSLIVTSALSLLMYTRVLSEAIASGRVGAAAQVLVSR